MSTTCDGSVPPGHVTEPGDCDDGNPDVWAVPGEPLDLQWSSAVEFEWSVPASPGGVPGSLHYDCLRSVSESDFGSGFGEVHCVETNDGGDTLAMDEAEPPVGGRVEDWRGGP